MLEESLLRWKYKSTAQELNARKPRAQSSKPRTCDFETLELKIRLLRLTKVNKVKKVAWKGYGRLNEVM